MRRRSTRNMAKSPDKSNTTEKTEPQRKLRVSRRRKRSTSKSDNEAEVSQNIDTNEELTQESQNSSVENVESSIAKQSNDSIDVNIHENSVQHKEETEEVEEENKGKSKGISDRETEQSDIVEPEIIENDNVQGTTQSPSKDNLESVQNSNDTQIDENKHKTNSSEENTCTEEKPEETNFESEYAQDVERNQISPLTNIKENTEVRSTTPEIPFKNKKIILKRSLSDTTKQVEKEKSTEDTTNPEKDKKSTARKITLKRHTVSQSNDSQEQKKDTELKKSPDHSEGQRRQSSASEETAPAVEAKPKKHSQHVKIIRHLSLDAKPQFTDTEETRLRNKQPWSHSNTWLVHMSSLYKIDVDAIKMICPTVEFLKEDEVKLDLIPPRERVKSENERTPKRSLSMEAREDEKQNELEEDPSIERRNPDAPSSSNVIARDRKISIVDDEASKLRALPSPAKHPPSDVLYIVNLVRPFTVKQLKDLLERTGKIQDEGLWTDRIKSKCYVRYETVDEAEATRNALHGVHWPVGNGKKLVIDFGTVEDMEKAKNPPPPIPVVSDGDKENKDQVETKYSGLEREEKKRRDAATREWDKGKEDMRKRSRTRSRSRERVRKHSRRSHTPEIYTKKLKVEEEPVPQKLMDDLFLKTKATPSIYWQPLSPEEIAKKQHQRLVRMEEHKRRIEETRERLRENRRGAYRRR